MRLAIILAVAILASAIAVQAPYLLMSLSGAGQEARVHAEIESGVIVCIAALLHAALFAIEIIRQRGRSTLARVQMSIHATLFAAWVAIFTLEAMAVASTDLVQTGVAISS